MFCLTPQMNGRAHEDACMTTRTASFALHAKDSSLEKEGP